jgi:GNAT superfamily N-acetyltransferase
MPTQSNTVRIIEADGRQRDPAVNLLARFFREEGFATPQHFIAEHLDLMLADRTCWAALAFVREQPVGIVTVTTMLYVEWGRLAEIGDLYVLPRHRGRGIARLLLDAALGWSRQRGCAGASVTVTPIGETRYRLSEFYRHLGFEATGRTTMSLAMSA